MPPAALSALLDDGPAGRTLAGDQLRPPHLVDSEIASGLRRAVAVHRIERSAGRNALDTWRRLALARYPIHPLLERVWELRENLTAYDAGYVALAESLDCALITADSKLSRAPGIRCSLTVVPR